jgi:Na+-transporting methylmalonyl-CoA/oxaloacetate decarboxylase gamma subunit
LTLQRIRRAVIIGVAATIAALALVVALRSLQHLEPAVDWGPMLVFAIPVGLLAFLWGLGLFRLSALVAGKPGIARAVTMGIEGFLLGALLVIVVRGLQNLDPIWDAGVGIVFMAIFASAFFVWGIGAFDPRMSVHAEAPEEVPAVEAVGAEVEAEETPGTILGTDLWRIAFLTIGVLVVVFGLATIPNFLTLQTVGEPEGNAAAVGYMPVQLPFGGPEIMVSELVFFALFVIWTFISLAVAAGVIGLLMYFLSRGVAATKGEPSLEDRTPPYPVQLLGRTVRGVAGWLRSGLPRQLGQR